MIFSLNALLAEEVDPKIVEKKWTKKYADIVNNCILKKFNKKRCKYYKNNTPLDVSSTSELVEGVNHGVNSTGRVIKTGFNNIAAFYGGGSEKDFQNAKINQDYDRILKFSKAKITNESLSTCQQACLATCISSRLISYRRTVAGNYQTCRGALESGGGDCKSFANLANDIMEYFGLTVQTDWGDQYYRDEEKKEHMKGAGHAMISVWIDDKPYLMEPQSRSPRCEFYDRNFKKEFRKVEEEYLQKVKKTAFGESATAGKAVGDSVRGVVNKNIDTTPSKKTPTSLRKDK
ncbi:MAG: hypothetical protein CME70_22485 [Halobacteriovorax sp.]|nr:hypothetical protein [Halobacteriovorax sp.]